MRSDRPLFDWAMTFAHIAVIALTPLLFQKFTPLPLWACIVIGVPVGIILFWLLLFGVRFASVTFITLTPLLLFAATPLPPWACFAIGVPGGFALFWLLHFCASRLLANNNRRVPG
jgi:hypothetical protein